MVITAISLILLCMSGLFDGLKDKSEEGRFKNIKLNKANSWTNKWKADDFGQPTNKERFPGSTTIFVFVTDFWHIMKWLQFRSIDTAIILATGWPWYMLLIIPFMRGICFEFTHRS